MRGFSKYITLLLAIALLLPVLAACGNGDDEGDGGGQEGDATPTEEVAEATPTEAEEMEATEEATEAATEAATEGMEATEEGTEAATEGMDATEEGTEEATEEATEEGTEAATEGMDATEEGTAPAGGGAGAMPGEGKTVRIGWIPWAEDVAATYLWQHLLEEKGYTVELTQLDAGTVFTGLAQGDLDLFLDLWLPTTHASYWDQYGDELEDLGVWYEPATLELTVPSYVDVDSIPALTENAEMFNSEIVGIEPGAGMMGILREDVMPGYGLEDWTLIESSTPAMIAELDSAISNEEPIVVTLWTPHWAYAAYDLKNLEDPQELWGGTESLHVAGRSGFAEDFPTLAQWMENFQMNDEALASLENLIQQAGAGNEAQAVEEWLSMEGNQELVNSWMSGGGGS